MDSADGKNADRSTGLQKKSRSDDTSEFLYEMSP